MYVDRAILKKCSHPVVANVCVVVALRASHNLGVRPVDSGHVATNTRSALLPIGRNGFVAAKLA